MPPRRVIGVDAGGTKLLGGVVDEQLVVHHRVHRMWRGSDRQETLDIFVEAVEEIRAAAPDVDAVGFGLPGSGGPDDRSERVVHAPAARGRPVPRPDERAARAAGPRGQRRERGAARRAPARCGGRARPRRDGPARHGHRRRARCSTGASTAARPACGAELGHIVVDMDGPRVPGRLPGARLPRGDGVGHRDRARGGAARGRAPRLGPRPAARAPGAEITRRDRHGARARGRRGRASRCSQSVGPPPRHRAREPRERAQPRGDRDRRRRGGGRRPAARARRARWWPSGRCPRRASVVEIVPAHFGAESGMLGAALLALDGGVS